MAYYMAIFHARDVTTPQEVQEWYAWGAKHFLAWKPPAGLTLHSLWGSLDNRTAFNLWETDDQNLVAQAVAYFAPLATYEVIPVVGVEDILKNWVAAGLIPADTVPRP